LEGSKQGLGIISLANKFGLFVSVSEEFFIYPKVKCL
jgi:hypothetical protein